ncbi:MAG: aldo/keto reductase [Planctomycetota bacterium]|nr:MAG: aldo/keto reductase [Planctomycetota bacterium]
MNEKQNKIDRRNFLKTVGAAGFGSILTSAQTKAGPNEPNAIEPNEPEKEQEPKMPQVPRRKLGKTDIEVPCLALGATFNTIENQVVLRKALEWGVTYWDTADTYAGGNSEAGIGKFLEKNPQMREKIFIVTKAFGTKTIEETEVHLHTSLRKLHTRYVDLYLIMDREKDEHGLSDPDQLTNDKGRLERWVKFAKRRKMIRCFGFSTHKNMAKCLTAASKLYWIDAIMTSYSFRLMQDAEMQDAVAACQEAGVGLIAMKTQAFGQKVETDEDKKLLEHFLQRGFTEGQAKIKAVLQDKRISSVCSKMDNIGTLTSNVAAVLDKTELTREDLDVFKRYAAATCSGYCAGCAHICDRALPEAPYVSEIMRYLMYYNSYGEKDRARELFAKIPSQVRNNLLGTDYSVAELRCPQQLPIGKLVAEAVSKLA